MMQFTLEFSQHSLSVLPELHQAVTLIVLLVLIKKIVSFLSLIFFHHSERANYQIGSHNIACFLSTYVIQNRLNQLIMKGVSTFKLITIK